MKASAVLLTALLVVAGVAATPTAAAAQESSSECSFPVTRADATGTEVTVEAAPERVVALGPSAAQTMWDIDGRDQVVGMPVNRYTSNLEGADERTNVFNPDGFTVNVERVVDLEPDLVLASNVIPDETVLQLRDAGLTVYKFGFAADLEDVQEKTRLTGQLTGNCEAATERVAWMEDRLATVREAVAGEERPPVVYPLGGGFVAGDGTFLHELIRTAGGRNVAAQAGVTGYGTLSIEVIVTRNPEWLVLNEGLPESALKLYAYNHTTALRQDQLIRVNPNYANQPAPRVVLVVEQIAKALHPEAYAAANATPTPSPTDTTTPLEEPTVNTPVETTTPPTETPGQGGFGVVVALAALLAALFAGRVRS